MKDFRLRTSAMILSQPIQWTMTADAEIPYSTTVEGIAYRIRVNDFPAERMYTLLRGTDEQIIDFDDWPLAWSRPAWTRNP